MYQVGINADPEHFLDWDRPLSEQSPRVQEALKGAKSNLVKSWLGTPEAARARGQNAYEQIADRLGGDTAAEHLRDLGIPGIKYLDQGSRDAGAGSHNYVVFDDKLIDILKKYGWAGLGLPAMDAALPSEKNQ
jgi:hypothetical protein